MLLCHIQRKRPVGTGRVLCSFCQSICQTFGNDCVLGKMADATEMPLGVVDQVGTRNDVLDRGQYPHGKEHFFWGGNGVAQCNI